MKRKNFGGPATCPRPCIDCDPKMWGHLLDKHGPDPRQDFVDQHHFNTVYSCEMAEDEPDHDAAKAGCEFWWTCKHCDAWCSDPDGDLEAA